MAARARTTAGAEPLGPAVRWRADERPCPACGTDAFRLLGRRGGSAHRDGAGLETRVVRCRACHLVYQRPTLLPDGNPYAAFEAEEYFAIQGGADRSDVGERLAERMEALLGRKGRLLELGCGRGALLAGARRRGWEVRGVDMTPGFSEQARPGVEIEVAPLESARSLDERYDAVWLAAVLEHVYEPARCLARVRAALAPGGVAFIDVPNECGLRSRLGNLYMRLRGRDWAVNLSPSFPPFHVVGFCPRSLARLLRATGFRIAELTLDAWRDALPARAGAWGRLESAGHRAVIRLAARLGSGDGITCWAVAT
jgi:SAM-dependent methyltransferase